MPLVLSHKNKFRGIFSQREILCGVIKDLMGCVDDSYESLLLIRCPSGQIKFDREDGTVECFCKFNYPALCRELKTQSKVAIFDSGGEEYLFAIWLTKINEVYYSPAEKVNTSSVSPIDIEESSVPVSDPIPSQPINVEPSSTCIVSRIFGEGPKMPDRPLASANLGATVSPVAVQNVSA